MKRSISHDEWICTMKALDRYFQFVNGCLEKADNADDKQYWLNEVNATYQAKHKLEMLPRTESYVIGYDHE